MRVFGKGNVPLRVNLRVTVRIEDRLRAELIQAKIISMISSSVRISVTHYNVKCLIFIKYFLSAAREFENIFDGNFL